MGKKLRRREKGKSSNDGGLKLSQTAMISILDDLIKESRAPIVFSEITDTGKHDYYVLVDNKTGQKLWSERPDKCKLKGDFVVPSQRELELRAAILEIKTKLSKLNIHVENLDEIIQKATNE